MKETTKLYLLLLTLFLFAIALMVFLLYDSGLTVNTVKNMLEGRDFVEIRAEETRRSNTVNRLKPFKKILLDSASYALYHRYPPQTEEGARRGLSVLMYHNVYDPLDPPAGQTINDNYITTDTLEEELKYLTDEGYSFPDWEEVRRYIDGEIDLPEKSVVLTFDDGTDGFKKNGIPLLKKYNVPATAFIIVSRNGDKWVADRDKYPDVDLESHSYDMHKAGGRIGHGGIMTALTYDQVLSDLLELPDPEALFLKHAAKSAFIVGAAYGDLDQQAVCLAGRPVDIAFVSHVTFSRERGCPGEPDRS